MRQRKTSGILGFVIGSVLALSAWRAVGWPRFEWHLNSDKSFRELRVVPTLKPWFGTSPRCAYCEASMKTNSQGHYFCETCTSGGAK